jgi:hypothetical protein
MDKLPKENGRRRDSEINFCTSVAGKVLNIKSEVAGFL